MAKLSDTISAELEAAETKTESDSKKVEVKEENPQTTTDNKAEEPKVEKDSSSQKEGGSETASQTTDKPKDSPSKGPIETKVEKATSPLVFKLKVEGEDLEVDQDEVTILAQKGYVSDKRFREASTMRKDAEQVLQYLEQDPFTMLERIFAHKYGDAERGEEQLKRAMITYLEPFARRAGMTPEEQATFDERRRLERERKEWEGRKAKLEAEEAERIQAAAEEEYRSKIVSAFKVHGLEDTPLNVKKVARILQESLEFDLGVTPEEAVARVKKDISKVSSDSKKSLSEDEILADKELTEKIRKRLIAQSTPPSTPPFPSTPPVGEEQKETKERAPRSRPIATMRQFHQVMEDAAQHG